ncbi:phytoene desaturase family protein [Corynebacterium felinum]|uniref:Phytoene desaturase n=1 Tax=Corynebacterium felinum TaxID=131318 RepID=A0ABU2B664_9CORY|nr:phytoene desaturase family protein [Corynebacterium felinum]MDF5821421.1 phytoene desaturase family protein [Corynebacterium felinum]MDR7353489.1 phytoene desaturase [Corynebacterium felinum]WJY95668.1 zeta-carotene-forming phytoene desaturase [Corynebacterium felinum]
MKIVVIGAGFAGLATAALLAHDGHEVVVVEKNSTPGGRAGELRIDSFRFDTGPSWYLMPEAYDHFFALLGEENPLELVPLTPAYRLFAQGHEPLDMTDPYDVFESIEHGAGEKLRQYLESAREVYELSIRQCLYTTFSNLRFIPLKLRFIKLLLTSLDSFVASQFTDTRLRQMLTYPAVFLSSHPKRTPALYHLMSHTDLTQGVCYPQGGFSAIVEAIYRMAVERGVEFHFNTRVDEIVTRGHHVTGVRCGDKEFRAEAVVSAADIMHTQKLLPANKRSVPKLKDPGIGTVLVMLGVEGKIPELHHHNLFFSAEWDNDFDIVFDGKPGIANSMYVSMPSQTDPDVAEEGCENLFILIPTHATENLGHGSAYATESPQVRAIAEHGVDTLAAVVPNLRTRIKVQATLGPADFATRYNAWRGGAIGPAHTLAQSAFLRGSNVSSTLNNLYYAGATTVPGVGVPMCLISAENALKRINGDTTHTPTPTETLS